MKELTREDLPDDGTHFVVTWSSGGLAWSETAAVLGGMVKVYCKNGDGFVPHRLAGFTNIRCWQFPEGDTKCHETA